jgi:ABC-2 type transport system permease protein
VTTESIARPTVGRLIWDQFRFQNRIFWRTPIAAFFTLVFPLMLLILFTAIFGNDEIEELGITTAQFFTPGLAVFAAVSSAYTGLAIGTAIARDNLILKRVRGTPIPPWAYIAGRVSSSVYVAAIAVALMMGVGIVAYGVKFFPRTIPAMIVTFLVGVACFAALGMLVAAISPNGDTVPAITNATLLPVAFISGIFFPLNEPPRWMEVAGNLFPLKHFAVAFRDCFDPTKTGMQFHWPELAYMALWGVGATVLAIRLFKWEPHSPSAGRRRRRPATGD